MTDKEKIVAMAKGSLMKTGFISSEIAAHRFIQKSATDRRVSMETVAREILNRGGNHGERFY